MKNLIVTIYPASHQNGNLLCKYRRTKRHLSTNKRISERTLDNPFIRCTVNVFIARTVSLKTMGQPPKEFVKKHYRPIYSSGLFKNIIKISSARVPLIKCVHRETEIACDVTFLNKFGLMNSRLIAFLITLDTRLRGIFVIIKYWAKLHNVAGMGRFTNYALCLLIIFYLQQLPEPILPSIKFLQDLVDDNERDIIEDCECSFCEDRLKVPRSNNTSTTKDLLLGFFSFFAGFDSNNYVISPLYGIKFEKKFLNAQVEDNEQDVLMDEFEQLPDATKQCVMNILGVKKHSFNENHFFSVQDPFDFKLNTTKNVPHKCVNTFIQMCKYTKDAISNPETKECDLLKMLFSQPVVTVPFTIKEQNFVINLEMSSFVLPNTSEKRDSELYKMRWFKYMKDAVLLVFSQIYKFEITPTPSFYSSTKLLNKDYAYKEIGFKCVCKSDVFSGRKTIKTDLVITKRKSFEQEVRISDHLEKKSQSSSGCLIHFKLICYPNVSPPKLSVLFVNDRHKKFGPFKTWLSGCLVNHCKLALQEVIDYKYGEKYTKLDESNSHMNSTPESERLNGSATTVSNGSPDGIHDTNDEIMCETHDSLETDSGNLHSNEVCTSVDGQNSNNPQINKITKRKFSSESSSEKYHKELQDNNKKIKKLNPGECESFNKNAAHMLLEAIERPFSVPDWT